MTGILSTRLAPGGSPIPLRALARLLTTADAAGRFRDRLQARHPDARLRFHASGREAMRSALRAIASSTGRSEVALPAYACFSIPASAIAAGLRIHLVDLDERGRLSADALALLPLERVAAIVVGNHFGLPDPIGGIRALARAHGTAVIDDAAQAFGAASAEGTVGARGDVGILSFGRGKPLSALGGGAAIWSSTGNPQGRPEGDDRPPAPGLTDRLVALARATAYDLSRHPRLLGLLAQIPALKIGETHFDPDFARGAMPRPAVCLAAALEPELDRQNRERRACAHALADRIRAASSFVPLVEEPGASGVFPRLAVLAPSASARDRALATLTPIGATAMYPTPIGAIAGLAGHLAGPAVETPGAQDFCRRLLTLPTHAGVHAAQRDRIAEELARA